MPEPRNKDRWTGFYRAKVTEVDIDNYFEYGAVRLFIPDLMDPDLLSEGSTTFNSETDGLIAYPANNPIGGRNDEDSTEKSFYEGCVFVPRVGSWVWIFFEGGHPNKPFYFSAIDIKNTMLPPECRVNQNGDKQVEPHRSRLIHKSHEGRTIVSSDSDDVQRIEITGKKRNLSGSAEGNNSSTYTIDGNMTVILLDERDKREKLLIRTYKGDFIHIDIDERELQAYFKNDIKIKTDGNFHLQVGKDIHVNSNKSIYVKSSQDQHYVSGSSMYQKQGNTWNVRSGGTCAIDGSTTQIQSGAAKSGKSSRPIYPVGERDT